MPRLKLELLSPQEIQAIHDTSLQVLRDVGMRVHHADVLERLAQAGAIVDHQAKTARFSEDLVMWALSQTQKQFTIYGRDPQRVARFGYGDFNLISSPGQYGWFDHPREHRAGIPLRRDPLLEDAIQAARVGDALPHITIVGAMTQPVDVPTTIRDVLLTAELVKHTLKPTRCWPGNRRSSHYVLEIYAALAGGQEALKRAPMVETLLEPISPLQLPETGLDVVLEFLDYGQPVSIGPMAMAGGSGPATLAGTLAQENAEILGGIVTVQVLAPGTPVIYGGIPHIIDPRTSICSFGSPEQGLMAVAMAEIGKHYGLPVYVNVNLTDAKTLDVQAGIEKAGSILLGMLAGADLLGHAGIVGTDHGGSLAWLVVDDEMFAYASRILRGFDLDEERLALPVMAEIGPGGNYLSHEHTVRHFRKELWIPDRLWTRLTFDQWAAQGERSMGQRAAERVKQILASPPEPPLEEPLAAEIDCIVAAAKRELL
jgi:trimethylamine--corrinoid protein Co-methyltransferase